MIIEVTEKGSDLPIGTRIEVENIPVWLVNKCKVIEDTVLEVATPKRKPRSVNND